MTNAESLKSKFFLYRHINHQVVLLVKDSISGPRNPKIPDFHAGCKMDARIRPKCLVPITSEKWPNF